MSDSGPIVLSLYDRTGNMVRPWLDAGYECWIVDTRHAAGENRDGRLVRVGVDILHWLPPRRSYAACFAFMPCTDVAVAGAKHFKDKGLDALAFSLPHFVRARRIAEWCECPYLLENPVGTISTYWREPDYQFDPCNYALWLDDPAAEAYTKRTCLWTGGGFVMPRHYGVEPVGHRDGQPNDWYSKVGGKSEKTKDHRSQTPLGFARAVFEANGLEGAV